MIFLVLVFYVIFFIFWVFLGSNCQLPSVQRGSSLLMIESGGGLQVEEEEEVKVASRPSPYTSMILKVSVCCVKRVSRQRIN